MVTNHTWLTVMLACVLGEGAQHDGSEILNGCRVPSAWIIFSSEITGPADC